MVDVVHDSAHGASTDITSDVMDAAARDFKLPATVVSPADLRRVRSELTELDDFLHQAALRTGGKSVQLPRASRRLDQLAEDTGANLLQPADRLALRKYLDMLDSRAPTVHISFASEPSLSFVTKLVSWLRSNIHPQVLVNIGLQPSIAAGCVIRTTNRQFDFSLAQAFDQQSELLINSLRGTSPAENVVNQ